MKEKAFENKIKSYLKENNCYFVKYWGGGYFTEAGIPDLLVCCNGYFLALEIKAKNGIVSDLQKYNIEQIKKAGGIAMAVYPKDFDDLKELIRRLNDE